MLENGMVLGEYYDEKDPDIECPHCGTGWYECSTGGWESDSYYSRGKSYGHPMHGNYCDECILDSSTPKRAAAFIERQVREDDKKFRTSYQIKSTILPRLVLCNLGADRTAMESRGYVDAYSCKQIYATQMRDRPDLWETEDFLKEYYEEEYKEYLTECEDGWHKEEE